MNKRKLILTISLLLFPIVIYYFSPALIIMAGLEGVINGSFIVFVAMFLFSIFGGRLFCAYLCPAGGLQECAFPITSKAPKQGWRNNMKYIIWAVWIAAVVFCYAHRGEIVGVNFFYHTVYGISIVNVYAYIIYYGIVLLIFLPAIIGGKRAFCHYFCWMAPFMVIGTKLRQALHLPGLQIAANKENCISCKICNKKCPMSVDVMGAIVAGKNDMECIQCGECIAACPKDVLHYRMKEEK